MPENATEHDNKLILVASSSTLSDTAENRLRANLDSSTISAEYSFPWSVQIDGPLSIDPATVTLPAEYTYTARVFDQNGDEMDGLEPAWSYSTTASGEGRARFNTDTGVLTIPENVESQTITITAEFGGAVGSIGVIIDRLIPTSIVIDGTETINSYAATEDREFTYTATVYDQNGTKMENQAVSWSFATDAGENAASFSNGVLTVPAGAADQTVTLTAECGEQKVEKKVVIMKTILDLPETFEAASSMKLRGLGNSSAISVDADIEEIGMKASAAGIFRFDLSKIVNDAENIITGLTFTLYRNTGANISLGVWEYADPEDTERTDSKTWIDGIDWTDNANKSAVMNNYSLIFGMDDFGVTHTHTSENYADGRTSYIAPLALATPEEGVYTFEITGDAAKKIIEHAKENNGMADLVVTSSNLDERSSSLSVLKVYMTGVKTTLNEDDDKYMPTLKVAYDLPSTPRKVEITGSDTLYINSRVDSYTSQFGAEVYDQFGELYEDQEVEWSIDYGETKNVSFNTSTGVMTINKNSEPGTVTITARSAFAEGTKTVSIERLPDNFRNGTFEDVDDSYLADHWTPNVPVYKINFDETDSYYPWNSMNSNDGGTLFTRTQGYAGLEETGEIRGTSGIDSLLKLEYSTSLSDEEALDLMNNNTQMLGINNSTANGFLDVGYEIPYYYMLDYYLSSDAEQMLSGEGLYTGLEFRNKSDSAFLSSVATGNQFFQFNRGRWRTFVGEFTSGTENQINGKARVNIGIRGMKGTAYLDYFRLVPKGLDTQNKYEGNNSMQVVNSLTWTSDVFSVEPESYYTYYVSARPESNVVSGQVTYTFMDNNYGVKGEYTVNTSEGEWLDTDVSGWKRTEGQIAIPSGATLCRITLSNPEGTGKIWFDGLVFTKTETAKADTIRITGGGDEAAIPESGTAQYQYTAVVYDQYNNIIPSGVNWAVKNVDGTECSGITITSNGVLRVDASAAPGSIIISASKDGLTAEKAVVIINRGESGIPESEGKYGFNGSFTENDGTYPYGWTNEDMDVVSYTFDNGIEGWKSTLNDYGAPEDGSLVWSSEENYTKKEGSSGSIDLDNPSYNQVGAQIPTDTKIQGGMLYNIETRFKAENISDDSVVRAYLRLFDTYGATIAEIGKLIQYYPDEYKKQKDENGWQRWSAREVVPKNATTVRPILYYRGGLNNFNGHAYFDDFRISKVTQLDYDNQYNGNPSLMLIGYNEDVTSADKDYGERWVSDKLLNISQGNSYKYSAMLQTYAADSGAYLSFIFYDEGGNEISTVESNRITGTTNAWTELSGTVTAPADAASVAVAYNIDGTGTSWISAISFDAMTDSGVAGIKIRGSSSVTIPANGNRSVGYTVETVNGAGNTIGAADAVITVSSLPSGVSFTNNMLTVSNGASAGTVTLSASYGSYSDTMTVTIKKSGSSGGGTGGGGGGGAGGGTTSTGQRPSGSKPQTSDNSPMGNTSYGQGSGTAADNGGDSSGSSEIPTLLQPPEIDYFTGGAKEKPFDDIDGVSWAKPSIEALYNAGVVAGKGDKIFAPLDNVTRAEFVTMLVKAFRLTSDNASNSFTDVSEGDWYNDYVNIAVGNGIVAGMSEDYFGASENITRQDIATMCMRLWNYLGKDMTGRYRAEFNDLDDVASYALEAVTSLAEAGIIVGNENGDFMPRSNATRAETAVIIYRLAVKYDE